MIFRVTFTQIIMAYNACLHIARLWGFEKWTLHENTLELRSTLRSGFVFSLEQMCQIHHLCFWNLLLATGKSTLKSTSVTGLPPLQILYDGKRVFQTDASYEL